MVSIPLLLKCMNKISSSFGTCLFTYLFLFFWANCSGSMRRHGVSPEATKFKNNSECFFGNKMTTTDQRINGKESSTMNVRKRRKLKPNCFLLLLIFLEQTTNKGTGMYKQI